VVETMAATSRAQSTWDREPANPATAAVVAVVDRRRTHSGENA